MRAPLVAAYLAGEPKVWVHSGKPRHDAERRQIVWNVIATTLLAGEAAALSCSGNGRAAGATSPDAGRIWVSHDDVPPIQL